MMRDIFQNDYLIQPQANKAAKRQESSTSTRPLLPTTSGVNASAVVKADDGSEIDYVYLTILRSLKQLKAAEEITIQDIDIYLAKDVQLLANVEKVGEEDMSFLHYLLKAPRAFDERLPLLKWAMKRFPALHMRGVETGPSILQVLASKCKAINTTTPLSKFVELYPVEVVRILKQTRSDKHQQEELLSTIIPAIKTLNVPQFLEFFDKCPQDSEPMQLTSAEWSDIIACEAGKNTPREHRQSPYPGNEIASEEIGDVIILRWPEESAGQIIDRAKKIPTKENTKSRVFKDSGGQTFLHLAASHCKCTNEQREAQLRLVETLFYWCPEALKEFNAAGQSPYLHRIAGSVVGSSPEPDQHNKDPIALFLKDKIMRLSDRDTVLGLLYGRSKGPRSPTLPGSSGPEREIHLDLRELQNSGSSSARKTDLLSFIDSLHFENILQYVQVPPHPFRAPADGLETKPDKNGMGRRDFKEIFDFLAKKGIWNIHRLVVDDEDACPHQDEVIEELRQFQIEEFQWRKLDLSSEVLREAVSDVRTLRLFSSGNHSVLREWSSAEGLSRLLQLRAVYLKIYWKVESRETTEKYAKNFIKRMIRNCPQVKTLEVRLEPFTAKTRDQWPNRGLLVATNKWLQTIQKFNTFITNIRQYFPEQSREIRVAVLDDGIDWSYAKSIGCHGKSFYSDFDGHKVWYSSSTDHGTLMTALVYKICPYVKLYVVRLEQTISEQGEFQPKPESAAKAIAWARQMDVHIISMSWTIPGDHPDLETAVQDAVKQDILMFGSASDQGAKNAHMPYMAKMASNQGPVICIGGAPDIGYADERARSEGEFFFPGQISGMPGPFPPLKSNYEGRTGSSVATAIAAGFTALIMLLVEMSPKYGADATKGLKSAPDYRNQLQKPENIRKIFKNLLHCDTNKPSCERRDDIIIPVEEYFRGDRLSKKLRDALPATKAEKAGELLDGVLERILRVLIHTYQDKKAWAGSDDESDDSESEA